MPYLNVGGGGIFFLLCEMRTVFFQADNFLCEPGGKEDRAPKNSSFASFSFVLHVPEALLHCCSSPFRYNRTLYYDANGVGHDVHPGSAAHQVGRSPYTPARHFSGDSPVGFFCKVNLKGWIFLDPDLLARGRGLPRRQTPRMVSIAPPTLAPSRLPFRSCLFPSLPPVLRLVFWSLVEGPPPRLYRLPQLY